MLLAKAKAAIIEHDQSMISLYRAALALTGYNLVGIAHDAPAALALLHNQGPDLVLVDFRLAGKQDGLDFIRDAKLAAPKVFTILITAVSLAELNRKIQLVQPDRILQKPFMLRTLLDLLNRRLDLTPLNSGTL
jgi:DNA-binding NtrC family response regulator